MSASFVIREIGSRRTQRVVDIPWAQPAQGAAVIPFTAWLAPGVMRRGSHRKLITATEAGDYPAPGYYAGYFPGSKLATANKITFKRRLQRVLELNEYPETPPLPAQPFAASVPPKQHTRTGWRVKPKLLELNSYPATPAGYYSGFYPGSALAKANSITFNVTLQTLPALDKYAPPVVPAQPFTAYQPPKQFYRDGWVKALRLLELNSYPATPEPLPPAPEPEPTTPVVTTDPGTPAERMIAVLGDGDAIPDGDFIYYATMDGPLKVSRQAPGAVLDWTFDFSDWLGARTIASVEWNLDERLTVSQYGRTTTKVTVWVSASAIGDYEIAPTITTSEVNDVALVDTRTIILPVRKR